MNQQGGGRIDIPLPESDPIINYILKGGSLADSVYILDEHISTGSQDQYNREYVTETVSVYNTSGFATRSIYGDTLIVDDRPYPTIHSTTYEGLITQQIDAKTKLTVDYLEVGNVNTTLRLYDSTGTLLSNSRRFTLNNVFVTVTTADDVFYPASKTTVTIDVPNDRIELNDSYYCKNENRYLLSSFKIATTKDTYISF